MFQVFKFEASNAIYACMERIVLEHSPDNAVIVLAAQHVFAT